MFINAYQINQYFDLKFNSCLYFIILNTINYIGQNEKKFGYFLMFCLF